MRDDGCIVFLQWALPRLGLSWPGFRKPRRQVCRRVRRRIAELGMTSFVEYRDRLETGADAAAEWSLLASLCRVTISRFLRDRAVWEALGRRILPNLARTAAAQGRAVRAWSAGCASGEEPYSLRIVWELQVAPRFPGLELEVVATDVDAHLLGRARRAVYPFGCLRELPADWRDLAFREVPVESGSGPSVARFQLRPELRRGIDLRREDVRQTAPPGPFDLVLCRNLAWTYFEDEVQRGVLARISAALGPGGVLVIGAHESLPPGGEEGSGVEPVARSVYRKVGRAADAG